MPKRLLSTIAAALLALGIAGCVPATAPDSDEPVRVVVDDAVATQVSAHLRGPIPFDDRMGTALVAQLHMPMEVVGAPVASYRAGDVVYSEVDREVFVFLSDGSAIPADGLTRLGELADPGAAGEALDGLEDLVGCASDCTIVFGPIGALPEGSSNSALPSAR